MIIMMMMMTNHLLHWNNVSLFLLLYYNRDIPMRLEGE
jgi:hypothetical protein